MGVFYICNLLLLQRQRVISLGSLFTETDSTDIKRGTVGKIEINADGSLQKSIAQPWKELKAQAG